MWHQVSTIVDVAFLSFASLSHTIHIAYCFFTNLSIYSAVFQVACVMTIWSQLQPAYAANMWNEALNKRLGTKVCCNLYLSHAPICVCVIMTLIFWLLTIN